MQARLREQERLEYHVSSPTRIYSSRPETPPPRVLTGAKVMVDGAESSEGTSNSSESAPVLQKEGRGVEHGGAPKSTHTHTLLQVADLKQYALILTSMREFVLFAIPKRGSLEQAVVEIL